MRLVSGLFLLLLALNAAGAAKSLSPPADSLTTSIRAAGDSTAWYSPAGRTIWTPRSATE